MCTLFGGGNYSLGQHFFPNEPQHFFPNEPQSGSNALHVTPRIGAKPPVHDKLSHGETQTRFDAVQWERVLQLAGGQHC